MTNRILGKLMKANFDNSLYNAEANTASSTVASNNNPSDNLFWYVSPDDFSRNDGDYLKSERIVKANVTASLFRCYLRKCNIQYKNNKNSINACSWFRFESGNLG
ncbi:MAG: hypothetical protein IPM96_14160 [Ignavibacteria bacterium]|nr:hypothetical protein [Ignavibacteria bacterium]